MGTEVHLTLAHSHAEVALRGDLDARAAAILLAAVESAKLAGCRCIKLHLDRARSADEAFVKSLSVLRRECAEAGGSFDVRGLVLLSTSTTRPPERLHLVKAIFPSEEAPA